MLLTVSQWLLGLNPDWGFLRVFQYLTFRAVMAAMTALLIGLGLGPWVIRRLTDLHERHAGEQAAALGRLREAAGDDTSVQGTVNKVVVILRDWVSNLDRDVLPAVRDGEESLRKEYTKALRDSGVGASPDVTRLLQTQASALDAEIARLPRD